MNINKWSKMAEEKWYVCTYNVRYRSETCPGRYENIEEAEEAARDQIRDILMHNADAFVCEAEVKCREATAEEISREIEVERRLGIL